MTRTTRKRLLIGAGGIVGLLIAAMLALPGLLDLNARKPEIIAAVKKATGRDLVLDGPISFSLLPAPTATLTGVKFFNVPGSKNPNMVEVKSVVVRPSLAALVRGGLEMSEVTLVEPKIVLEINPEGRPNWEFAPSVAEARPVAAKPATAKAPAVGRVTIDKGTLIFSDPRAGLSVVAEQANFSASLGGLDGPYSAKGAATINGAPLTLDLSVGARGATGHAANLALEAGGGSLSFKGELSGFGPDARLVGIASSQSGNLLAFADVLFRITGQPLPALPPLLAGKFTFDGAIEVSQADISARDFKLALGQDSGSGSLTVTLKPALAVDARLAAERLDLDRWLVAINSPGQPPATSAAASPPPGGAMAIAGPASSQTSSRSLLASVRAKLALEIGEVIYNQRPVRSVALELEARDGAVAVPRLSATLPGDLVLQAKSTLSGDATRPSVNGEFSLVGPKLRETLAWMSVDVSSVPPAKLARLSLKGRMSSNGGNVQVSDAVFELDDLKGTGGLTVTFGLPLSIAAQIGLDTLDLDSFMAAVPAEQKTPPPASSLPVSPSAAHAGPSIGLKARIAKLIWRKETIGGVDVDLVRSGTTLRLNDIKVANLAGARLTLHGTVADYAAAQPRPDIAFNFETPDMDRVLKLLGAKPAGLGSVRASGGVAGGPEQLALRDFMVNAAGQNLRASGTLVLKGAAQGVPTSASYRGGLIVNGQRLDGSIEATLAARPHVTADLKADVLEIEKIGGGTAAAAGAPRGQPVAVAKPLDPGPLRGFDGNFKLAAASLATGSMRIANVAVAATLKDGVLNVSHLKGGLYGGTLDFIGTVDATRPALALEFKGNLNDIHLGEMLRSTAGSNQFGSNKVTMDGKLDANAVTVKGVGSNADQVRRSLAGGAQLGGHLFIGADRTLQLLGSAAAGVAGGVIDNALGSALGIVGQRGGVSVGNLLNAISLVLNRFINRENPISGRIDIAGGVLTDSGLAVQGNRSTATISTRTNLVAATTDTTISFVIAEDPSAPYLITTARGALSSPALNVTRGSAQDPPGMASTLPGAGAGAIPGIGNLLPGPGSSPGGTGSNAGGDRQQQRSPLPFPLPNIFGR